KGGKHQVWDEFFKMDNKIFNQNNCDFDYAICTDCESASIRFVRTEDVEKIELKKECMKIKRLANLREKQEITKNMTPEQVKECLEKIKKEREEKEKEKKEEAIKKKEEAINKWKAEIAEIRKQGTIK